MLIRGNIVAVESLVLDFSSVHVELAVTGLQVVFVSVSRALRNLFGPKAAQKPLVFLL